MLGSIPGMATESSSQLGATEVQECSGVLCILGLLTTQLIKAVLAISLWLREPSSKRNCIILTSSVPCKPPHVPLKGHTHLFHFN